MKAKTVTFPLPSSLGGGDLVVRELSAQMELDAAKESAENGSTRTALLHAISKRSVVSYQGKAITWEDAGVDEWWDALSAKERRFVMNAVDTGLYDDNEIEELKDFLAAKKVNT